MEPAVSIRNLVNAFGRQRLHDQLNLDVMPGEILGIVGGSGTGKSVLMRSIIGLQTPAAGEVEVLGENMIGREEDEAKNIRRRWGILFQNGALFSTLTVAENVEALAGPQMGLLVITHYQRLLNYVKPDRIHVLVRGRIVESGGVEIVEKLEAEGYESYLKDLPSEEQESLVEQGAH